jgi:hypothetical protein
MRLTGYPSGRPGYVADLTIPLACGGPDTPENMQWQTIEEARRRTRTSERTVSRERGSETGSPPSTTPGGSHGCRELTLQPLSAASAPRSNTFPRPSSQVVDLVSAAHV